MKKEEHIKKCQQILLEKPYLKVPVMINMIVYLALYHLGRSLLAVLPKVMIIALSIIAFVFNVSFDPAYVNKLELSRIKEEAIEEVTQEDLRVMLESDEGDIEAAGLELSELSASLEDIEKAAQAAKGSATINVDPGKVDDDTLVYDERQGKYITPDFGEDWSLILVNKTHLIPKDYEVELATIRGDIKADIRIVDKVLEMIAAARDDNVYISICSPYRDYDRQVMLFNRKIKSYTARGYSKDEAYELASNTVAIPGTSEHQLGLAFDFISNDYHELDEGFADTDAGKWLKANAADYGFILRYPKDKVDITDIQFEPWHYRYVGKAAKTIMDRGLCLEEYADEIGLLDI